MSRAPPRWWRVGDTTVLELDAEVFRRLGAVDPQAIEQVALAAVTRRIELDKARSTVKSGRRARAYRDASRTDAAVPGIG